MKIKKIIYTVILCAWLAFIFLNSASDAVASEAQSDGVLDFFQKLFKISVNPNFLRKSAHFTEFFILGIIAVFYIPVFGRELKRTVFPVAACGVFAGLADETIQLFFEGRSAQVSDVWLDYSAYLLAVLTVFAFLRGKYKRAYKNDKT